MILPLNEKMTVSVQGIQLNSDTFRNRESVNMYCHLCSLLLSDGQTVIKAQLCVDVNTVPWFKIGDKIEITLSNYKPGKEPPYTFKYIATLAMSSMGEKGESVTPPGYNPMVAGTVSDRALGHAIALLNGQKIPAIKKGDGVKETGDAANLVINLANIFKDYFLDNLQ